VARLEMYGLEPASGAPVFLDRFALPNANAVVLAQSGAGKSYAVKVEILRALLKQPGTNRARSAGALGLDAMTLGGERSRLFLAGGYGISRNRVPSSEVGLKFGRSSIQRAV
jgi:hypothetical protein